MEEDAFKQLPSIISAILCSKLAHHEKIIPRMPHELEKKNPTH